MCVPPRKSSSTKSSNHDFSTLADGWGYWVDSSVTDDFTFDGWELVADTVPPSPPPAYDVFEGWNLIGFKSVVPKPASAYLAGIAGKYVMIYGYDGENFFVVGTTGHESFEPGFGYWLAVVLGPGETKGTIYP